MGEICRNDDFVPSSVMRAHNLLKGDSWRCGSRGAFDELVGGGGMLPREWCSLVSKGRGVCGVIARGSENG